jgi:hypothetical protein
VTLKCSCGAKTWHQLPPAQPPEPDAAAIRAAKLDAIREVAKLLTRQAKDLDRIGPRAHVLLYALERDFLPLCPEQREHPTLSALAERLNADSSRLCASAREYRDELERILVKKTPTGGIAE